MNDYIAHCHEVYAEAADMLEEYMPRLMTLEEASSAEVCWIEKRIQQTVMVCKVHVYAEDDYTAFIGHLLPYVNENVPMKDYGKQWRCWNTKPTDAQRKAVKWDD